MTKSSLSAHHDNSAITDYFWNQVHTSSLIKNASLKTPK